MITDSLLILGRLVLYFSAGYLCGYVVWAKRYREVLKDRGIE